MNDTVDGTSPYTKMYEQQNSLTEIPGMLHSRFSNESSRSLTADRSIRSPPYYGSNKNEEQQKSLTEISFNKEKYSRLSNDSSSSMQHDRSVSVHGGNCTSSLNRSNRSTYSRLRRAEQNNSLTEISMRVAYQSRVSNDSSTSLIMEKSGFSSHPSPVRISPLDPSKLWEETEGRLGRSPSLQDYMALGSSKNSQSQDRNALLTVTPDESRGITRLSLSYSDLQSAETSANRSIDNIRNRFLQTGSGSLNESQSMVKSLDSLGHSCSITNSRMLSFSDMSLPLPDNSSKMARSCFNQQDLVKSTSKDSAIGRGYKSVERKHRKRSSPLNHSNGKNSVDSLSSRDFSSSYLSDRGLSSSDRGLSFSDRGLSSSSHTNDTSSGFQSEASNLSGISPLYCNLGNNKSSNQFQSTPIAENEIATITEPRVAAMVNRRTSLDTEIDAVSGYASRTPMNPEVFRLPVSVPPQACLFAVEKELDTIESPVLPPLRVSRRPSSSGSSGSGKYFKEPTLDESPCQENTSYSSNRHRSAGSQSRVNSSTYLEKSSLSALLSDMSCSNTGGARSSEESLSMSSNPDSLKRSRFSDNSDSCMRKAASLPYLDSETSEQIEISSKGLDMYTSLPHPRRVSDYLCSNTEEKKRLQELYNEISEVSGNRLRNSSSENVVENQVNDPELDLSVSPERLGACIEVFDRDHWRASLDKEMKERLVADMEKMAPKKLYQLKSKSDLGKRKVSPVNIAEYTESPYKFRKPQTREMSLYENLTSVSRDSLASECDSVITNTTAFHDYENLYMARDNLSGCPIATPESLSDVGFADDYSQTVPKHGQSLGLVRGELFYDPVPESVRSDELSRTKSPINISGLNSAFKPVKSKKGIDSFSVNSGTSSDTTYTVSDENTSDKPNESVSNNSISPDSLTQSVTLEKSVKSTSVLGEKSGRRSNVSQYSIGSETGSSFQWSQASDTESASGVYDETPRNYLKMVGKNALSFSMSTLPRDDVSSQGSQHSYTDSIPWDDTENKSLSFQNPDKSKSSSFQNAEYSNIIKSCPRQPLKQLENTPAFSPIYGYDRRLSLELSSRKRFMSTPKLSTGSELSVSSKNSEDESLMSGIQTPHRRRSSGVGKKSFSDNTSTWSTQSENEGGNSVHEHSTFGLSKTAYI